jgi:uncharacterized delta-60 repeat protein
MKQLIILTALFLFTVNQAQSQHRAGTLDSSFGNNGISILNSIGVYSDCNDASLQSDGKIICVGSRQVMRFAVNGLIDTTFGSKGIVTPFFYGKNQDSLVGNDDDTNFIGTSVAVLPDNKMLFAGNMGTGSLFNRQTDIVIMRLTADGSIDSSFGDNGGVIADYSKSDRVSDIKLQPDGKILVFGTSNNHFNLLRFLHDGTQDNSFGNNGNVWETSFNAYGNAIALQPDGKIVAAGSYENKIILTRYMPDGSRDNEFGNNGKVVSVFETENNYSNANDIAIQPDGKIVIAGNTNDFLTYTLLLARYNPDGSADESFGEAGTSRPELTYDVIAERIALDKNNKLIVGGFTIGGSTDSKYMLLRLLENGNLDSNFAVDGQQFTNMMENSSDISAGLILTSTNKIIVAGTTSNGSNNYASLAQYYNDDKTNNQTPIARIKRWLHKHGITWGDCPPSICNNLAGYAVQRSNNGINWVTIFKSRKANSYEDPSPLSGTNYYRLQTVSTDGAVAYSNVIMINSNEAAVRIYPNPAKNVLHIEGLSSNSKNPPAGSQAKITVADFMGNLQLHTVINAASGSINIATLKPGNYIVKIEAGGEVVVKKFIKE